MVKTPQDVTEAELGVLQDLWAHPEATIREITARLYERSTPSEHATVQKLLDRLTAKGHVDRTTAAPPHRYRALLDRDALVGQRLRALADTLCEGSITPLVSSLLRAPLAAEDVEELRALVERLGPGSRS